MNHTSQPTGAAYPAPSSATLAVPRWRRSALAIAAALVLGGTALQANALGLGRLTILSSIGEPLRAEIDVPQATAEELASLRAAVADPAAFRAAGMDLNPLLISTQITVQRRANGSYYLRLAGDRPVMEPFIDLVLDANWANGRIVREFTMLFDPPNTRAAVPATIAPQLPPSAATAPSSTPAATPAPAAAAQGTPGAASGTRPAAGSAATAARGTAGADRITVQPGDSAGRIAERLRPPSISLDQMLVALLRGNPDAFLGDNVNRLRAGAVLDVPSAEQAAAVPAAQARQLMVAQSRDFNEFRRRLAQGVTAAPDTPEASRSDAGKVQAQVEERGTAARPDRLTLSKAAVQGKAGAASAEEQLARGRAAQENATRVAELNRNIAELNRLSGDTAATATAATAAPGATPASGAAAGAAVATAAAASGAASVAAGAPAAALATPAPLAAGAKPAPATDESPIDGVVASIAANPLLTTAAGGMAALVLAYGLARLRRRRKGASVDSSFLESKLQPDSFFGASGGQRIDTAESVSASVTGSSMVYSPSQLDAAGDVDPVAEADVYLAYGRDLQAEEILKEALRTNPQRTAIHLKLLEIYARRRDVKAFEHAAKDVHALTQGSGPQWAQVCALGLELEPSNEFYRRGAPASAPSSRPAAVAAAAAAGAALTAASSAATQPIVPMQPLAPMDDFAETGELSTAAQSHSSQSSGNDVDLDLDLDLDGVPAAAPASIDAPVSLTADERIALALRSLSEDEVQHEPPAAAPAPAAGPGMDLHFDRTYAFPTPPAAPAAAPADAAPEHAMAADEATPELDLATGTSPDDGLSFDLDEAGAAMPAVAAAPDAGAAAQAADKGDGSDSLMEFDLDSISLDLDAPASKPAALPSALPSELPADLELDVASADHGGEGDGLATKLALAEEFNAIGDADGARSLAQEVLAEASGALRERAERLLAEIG